MITVVLQGGLGNQLFQYAYGRALETLGKEVIYDEGYYILNTKYTKRNFSLKNFKLNSEIKLLPICAKQSFIKRVLNKFDPDVKVRYVPIDPTKDNYIADGYYNSDKYFVHIRDTLLSEIVIREKSPLYREWEDKIKQSNKPLIIHARRTDYLNSPGFVVLEEEYYKEALENMDSDCDLFGFSDDPNWLLNAVKSVGRDITMVSALSEESTLKDYEELSLMTLGQNFIIANSTFSWWGAWLSTATDKKVIAPKNWFAFPTFSRANSDVVPGEWLRL